MKKIIMRKCRQEVESVRLVNWNIENVDWESLVGSR